MAAEDANGSNPTVSPGYLLTLHSLTDPKLDGSYRVDFKGNLVIPYDVVVNAAGLTLSALREKILEGYKQYFKTPPELQLTVKERRYWLDVRGLVDKPGRYMVEPGASLDTVISTAGGLSKDTPPLYLKIQQGSHAMVVDLNAYFSRQDNQPKILGWLGGEELLFQKDAVGLTVNESNDASYRLPIYMLGEVRKPGGYILTPGSDFVDSLVEAGGFSDRADIERIEIVRKVNNQKRIYEFSWNQIRNHQVPAPLGGDVVLVHAENTSRFERRVTIFAAIVSALAAIATAVILGTAYSRNRI